MLWTHDSKCRTSLEFAKSLPFIEYRNRSLDVVCAVFLQ